MVNSIRTALGLLARAAHAGPNAERRITPSRLINYRDKDAGGIPLPHRTHRHCHSPMQAPVTTLNATSEPSESLSSLGTQVEMESRPSDLNPDRLVQICWQPNAPCEICEGEHPDRVPLAKD